MVPAEEFKWMLVRVLQTLQEGARVTSPLIIFFPRLCTCVTPHWYVLALRLHASRLPHLSSRGAVCDRDVKVHLRQCVQAELASPESLSISIPPAYMLFHLWSCAMQTRDPLHLAISPINSYGLLSTRGA